MNFEVYTIGDGVFVAQVFDMVAALFNYDGYVGLLAVGMLLGVILLGFKAVITQQLELQHFLLVVILYYLMFGIREDIQVTLEDSVTGDVWVVDNVPVGVAAGASIISTIGVKGAELFEQASNWPTITEDGYLNTLQIIVDARQVGIGGEANAGAPGDNVRESIRNYIMDCTLQGEKMDLLDMDVVKSAPDALAAIRWDSEIYTTRLYLGSGLTGQLYTCSDAYPALVSELTGPFLDRWDAYIRAQLGMEDDLSAWDAGSTLSQAVAEIAGAGVSAQLWMLNNLLYNLAVEAAEGDHISTGDVTSALLVEEAVAKRNVQFAAEQSLFRRFIRPMMSFVEALIYAVSPLMVFLFMIGPLGLALGAQYLKTLVWVTLWKPVIAILNMFIHMVVDEQMTLLDVSGVTRESWEGIYSSQLTIADWLATGGALAASTPAITLFLVWGGAYAAVHVAGRMQRGDFIDESKTAPSIETVAPVLTVGARYHAEATMGTAVIGAERTLPSIQLAQDVSRSVSSAERYRTEAARAADASVSTMLRESDLLSERAQSDMSFARSVMARGGQAMQVVYDKERAITQGLDLSHEEQQTVRYALALGLALSAGGSVSDRARAAEQARNAFESFQRGGVSGRGDVTHQSSTSDSDKTATGQRIADAVREDRSFRADFESAMRQDARDSRVSAFESGVSAATMAQVGQSLRLADTASRAYDAADQMRVMMGTGSIQDVLSFGAMLDYPAASAEAAALVRYAADPQQGGADLAKDFRSRVENLRGRGLFVGDAARAEKVAAAVSVMRAGASEPSAHADGIRLLGSVLERAGGISAAATEIDPQADRGLETQSAPLLEQHPETFFKEKATEHGLRDSPADVGRVARGGLTTLREIAGTPLRPMDAGKTIEAYIGQDSYRHEVTQAGAQFKDELATAGTNAQERFESAHPVERDATTWAKDEVESRARWVLDRLLDNEAKAYGAGVAALLSGEGVSQSIRVGKEEFRAQFIRDWETKYTEGKALGLSDTYADYYATYQTTSILENAGGSFDKPEYADIPQEHREILRSNDSRAITRLPGRDNAAVRKLLE